MYKYRLGLIYVLLTACFGAHQCHSDHIENCHRVVPEAVTGCAGSKSMNQNIGLDIDVSMTFGKSIGVDESYASLGTIFTKFEPENYYFADVRWHHLCDGDNGLNAGLGLKYGDVCKGVGVNLYYDWRYYQSKSFQQVDFGIDMWLRSWEFRLRAYLPLESYAVLNKYTIDYTGGYYFTSKTTAYTCQVASLLAGRNFRVDNRLFSNLDCRGMIGPYWISKKHQENKYGGMASLDVRFHDYFSLKGLGSYDPIFNGRFELVLSVNIPFGCQRKVLCDCPSKYNLDRPVRLDLIPIKKETKCSYNWTPQ